MTVSIIKAIAHKVIVVILITDRDVDDSSYLGTTAIHGNTVYPKCNRL